MTPSDKKRMMDQNTKISVPELTPERKANANHRKDRESNKSEEFKQINTNRKRILIVMKLMALSMILIQQVIIAYMKHHPNNTMSKYKSYKMIFILRTQTMLKLTIQMKLAIKVI